MKHYMDIEHIKRETEFLKDNTIGFHRGDRISITEKIDGANASFKYNPETKKLDCFSRKQELNETNTLRGFWNWVQELDTNIFIKNEWENYIFFGEWLVSHTVPYNKEAYQNFYLFDIYDTVNNKYLVCDDVIIFADRLKIKTVPYIYIGPFISWEVCYEFLGFKSALGDNLAEGIVVRNELLRNDGTDRNPHTLKIVNEEFKETIKRKGNRHKDPEKIEAKQKAEELGETIVTLPRVRKRLLCLIDEKMLPEKLDVKDMGLVAKVLPRAVYEDCLKEEEETVKAMGEYAGKVCNSLTMKLAREIILS